MRRSVLDFKILIKSKYVFYKEIFHETYLGITGSKQSKLARKAVYLKMIWQIINNVWHETEYPQNSRLLICLKKTPSTKNYFLNAYVPLNILFDLFEWAEKPKWKWMAWDIHSKLLKYFNEFPRTKSYILTQFVTAICFLLSSNKWNTLNKSWSPHIYPC